MLITWSHCCRIGGGTECSVSAMLTRCRVVMSGGGGPRGPQMSTCVQCECDLTRTVQNTLEKPAFCHLCGVYLGVWLRATETEISAALNL